MHYAVRVEVRRRYPGCINRVITLEREPKSKRMAKNNKAGRKSMRLPCKKGVGAGPGRRELGLGAASRMVATAMFLGQILLAATRGAAEHVGNLTGERKLITSELY